MVRNANIRWKPLRHGQKTIELTVACARIVAATLEPSICEPPPKGR